MIIEGSATLEGHQRVPSLSRFRSIPGRDSPVSPDLARKSPQTGLNNVRGLGSTDFPAASFLNHFSAVSFPVTPDVAEPARKRS